jgi:hypothetical protein
MVIEHTYKDESLPVSKALGAEDKKADTILGMLTQSKRELWLPRVLMKSYIFLFSLGIFTLTIYLAGNFQEFLDSTQFILLNIFQYTSIIACQIGLANLVFQFVTKLHLKLRGIITIAVTFLSLLVMTGFLLAVEFAMVWFTGYTP